MIAVDDLLKPIPGQNSSGEYLRHSQIYDRIKEARREEDDAPQGEWAREIKKADFLLVCNLATEALRTKTKDLQIAAWLTEALTRREGFAGLRDGLALIVGLIENFWNSLYPELEDGDAELRAGPLEWIATRFDGVLKRVPLTSSGLNWISYKQSRSVGYEQDCQGNEARLQARSDALGEGKICAEAFDDAVTDTPREFYANAESAITTCLELLDHLSATCDAKFGDLAPSFSSVRAFLEEGKVLVSAVLASKSAPESAPESIGETVTAEEPITASDSGSPRWVQSTAPAPTAIAAADKGDPASRLVSVAASIRAAEPYSPIPYLLLRAYRWGELLSASGDIDVEWLQAPSSGMRQSLKALVRDAQWLELLDQVEFAMTSPAGRAWLDLQRYTIIACQQLGSDYISIASSVKAALNSLLTLIPELPHLPLTDDTPAASPDTLAWLQSELIQRSPASSLPVGVGLTSEERTDAPDIFLSAQQLAQSGDQEQAIQLLTSEIMRAASGRERFQRKVQLARICLQMKQDTIAYPILTELAQEIGSRNLDQWESRELIAQPLALLLQCMETLECSAEQRNTIYERLCRLDPVQALACTRTTSRRHAA